MPFLIYGRAKTLSEMTKKCTFKHIRQRGSHMKKLYSGVFVTHVKCTREETMRLLEKNDAQMLELLYHENCTSISLQPELVHTQVRESSIQ